MPRYDRTEAGDSQEGNEDALRGFSVGVYRLGDLLTDTFTAPTWDSVDIDLMDVTNPDDVQVMAERSAIAPASEDLTTEAASWTASDSFDVYGRSWQLEALPTSGPLATPDRQFPTIIELGGLVVLLLLQSFVLLVTGLERSARRQAERAPKWPRRLVEDGCSRSLNRSRGTPDEVPLARWRWRWDLNPR